MGKAVSNLVKPATRSNFNPELAKKNEGEFQKRTSVRDISKPEIEIRYSDYQKRS